MKIIYVLIVLIFNLELFAQEVQGQIVLLRGQVTVSGSHASKNQKINEGAIVETGIRSFTKIKFSNGSSVVVGANSKIVLSQLSEEKPRVLNLLKGKIRADVEKAQSPNDYTMFIKTKTASIGVRGTRFLLTHNSENLVSSVLTFEGEVHEFKYSDKEILESVRIGDNENINMTDTLSEDFKNNDIQVIRRGQYAGSFPGRATATKPVRISLKQFLLLEQNDKLNFDKQASKRVVITEELIAEVEKDLVPSEGSTQGRDGGALDIDTGIYISPPENAVFDRETRLYEMPSYFGSIDEVTGEYLPPEGLSLHPTDGFIVSNLKKGASLLLELQSKLNSTLDKGISKFKDITHTDFEGFAKYFYDTNVHETYYGERRGITNTNSMTWDLFGSLAHQTIATEKISIRPKVFGRLIYHNRRKRADVKREDLSHIGGGLEIDYFIEMFKNKAALSLETNIRTFYKDRRNRNQFDFYNEDIVIIPSVTLRPTRKNIIKFAFENTWFQGFDNTAKGRFQNYQVNIVQLMGKRYDAIYDFAFSKRDDQIISNEIESWTNQITLLRKNFFERFNVALELAYEKWSSHKELEFKKADLHHAKISLDRNWGNYNKIVFSYEFNKQNTFGRLNQRELKQNLYEVGLVSSF
ncbi:FecR domain-containing protein [Bacteriovorax sp. Seq25_V]|uniref:FecR family protein n=1 Tax=Bacteriovorax sp. Seq25_V TaxID=1201288 RepID=UPI000389FDFA|nr:FecR family protein [Bacteriovorax sp. Seq25_V]EQC47557.1 sigma factor regulatory protein, FecR/PupR family [Bacteriovorax sp. Seq25_V]